MTDIIPHPHVTSLLDPSTACPPAKTTSDLVTRTGFRFHVRPTRVDDDGTIKEFFEHVTRADLRFRFLNGLNHISAAGIALLSHPDHEYSENFLAFTEDGSMMIATGMLACDKHFDRGEVAMVIREDHKNKGISWELLTHIARVAETKGIKRLESIESRDNHQAISLERDMGFVATEYPGDPTLLLVSRTFDLT